MQFLKKNKPIFSRCLTITPPLPMSNRREIAIVATVRNEEQYIADWADFHWRAGVGHFVIYDDGSIDDTLGVLRRTLPEAALTVMPWSSRMFDEDSGNPLNGQVIAFAHAILNFGARFRWMMFIDVDEYVFPKIGETIGDALQGAGGFPCVSLPWHMFGPGGHKRKPQGSVAMNFVRRAASPINRHKNIVNFKCIVDPCEVTAVSVHHFETRMFGEVTVNDAGLKATRKKRRDPSFYSSKYLQLNHYYSKSEEELDEKLSRGPASPESRARYAQRVRDAVANIEAHTTEDRAIIDYIARRR
ncbi:hypothetical protein J2Y48_003063 [Mycoplana sp. BE70]|uniref:glycosyltransferase family 92 protein n=1 Tax=Mycoplana sp. BE70 TaxID=2817775 RepID=UPI002860053D|nr:glycosyltransferase family 92 protein [Mycoplana sp. BE70]MDR6757766.1 hypothetical protein [Mycoplana sp. BE70]